MKICKIWDAEYPWDVRAEKIARSLTVAGHEVHMVARNRNCRPLKEDLPEATVHRLTPWWMVGRRLSAASMFPAFFNPRWLHLIHCTARSTGAEVIVCRDVPLAPSAIWVGRSLGLPVVLDIAENYPAMIRAVWDCGATKPFDWLVRNPRTVALAERWAFLRAHHILVVVEESRDRVAAIGVPPHLITVVSNTPPRSRVAEMREAKAKRDPQTQNEVEVVYLGLLEEPRGIGELIDATALCRSRDVPVRLRLIGDGRERAAFENRSRERGLEPPAVEFLGYLPNEEAQQLIAAADVGVVPHYANESWNTTIPNKLFDYMAAGIPVVTSDAKPTARVVADAQCGEVFRDRDVEDLADALQRLCDPDLRRRFGKAGRAAVLADYNWETDTERLLEAVESVGTGSRDLRGATS